MEVHPEKCFSCRACQLTCSMVKFGVFNPKKSLLRVEEGLPYNKVVICDQCGRCAEVCPVNAIYKEEDVWLIDHEKCVGCGTCVRECPLQVMIMVDGKAYKCDWCGACVEGCTLGALKK